MGHAPLISVVIPHYLDLENLGACLDALQNQTLPRDRFEIIVADNDSPVGRDAVAEVVGGRARLVTVSTRGAGAARNGGVAIARGDVLAFTDADCKPRPDWLETGLRGLVRFDIVGGSIDVEVRDPHRMSATEAFESIFAFRNELYINRKDFTVTANMFCRRAAFARVGDFAALGLPEDWDWCNRALKLGLRLGYVDDCRVSHPARRDWPELLKKWRRINSEHFGLIVVSRRERLLWAARTAAMPFSAIAHTPMVLTSPKVRGLRNRMGALWTLYRLRLWRTRNSLALAFQSDRH